MIAFSFRSGFDFVEVIQAASGVRPWVSIGAFILGILIPVLFFMALVALLVIVVGGIMYITALGDEDKARTAKNIILYAIIGLAVIMLAGVFVNFVILLFT